jgi:hypothetical protein
MAGEATHVAAAEASVSSASVAGAMLGCHRNCGQQQDERRNGRRATHGFIVRRF